MKSKRNLMLLAALCGCLVMTGTAIALTISVAATDVDLGGNAIIRVVRQDGESLAATVSVDGSDVAVDGDTLVPLTVGDHEVVLPAIDPDLVTLNVIDSAVPDVATVYELVVAPVEAKIKMSPRSINVDSKGNWINCKIQLPGDYPVEDMQTGTVEVSVRGEVEVDGVPEEYLVEGVGTSSVQVKKDFIMVKIKRSDITDPLKAVGANGSAEVTVAGELDGGLYFEGTQMLKIINNNETVAKAAKAAAKASGG